MTSVEQQSATFRPSALLGGSLSPRAAHLPFASDLIAALKPSTIVELGVSYGDTYFGFCQLVAERQIPCSLYGVDTWPAGRKSGNKNQDFDTVDRHNKANYQSFSRLVRKGFDEAMSEFGDSSIGLLSLAAAQPYQPLKHTFDAWLTKVKLGGVILINNISVHGGETGAARLWNEIKTSFPSFAFRHNTGLGVLARSPKDSKQIAFLAELFDASPEEQDRIRRHYSVCSERLELSSRRGASPMSDSAQSLFQVFRSQNARYETAAELGNLIPCGGWVNLNIELPNGTGDLPLRLDIVNRPAVVDIATLSLRTEDGHTVWSWNPKDLADQLTVEGSAARMPEREFYRVLALGSDPQVFLPPLSGPVFGQSLELEIRLRVDLELAAVKRMNQEWESFQRDKEDFEAKKLISSAGATPADVEAAVARTKADAAKYLAQARIDYEAKLKQLNAEADARLNSLRSELEALRSEMEATRAQHQEDLAAQSAQLAEERRSHQVTMLDKENLLLQQPRLLQEISIAQGNVEELKAEVERLSGELASTAFDLSEVRKLNARINANLEEEHATRRHMQESGSWQLTKPLRAVGDLFGPRKKY